MSLKWMFGKGVENIGNQRSDLRDRLTKTMRSNINLLGNKIKTNSTSKCPWRINARNPLLIFINLKYKYQVARMASTLLQTILHVSPEKIMLVSCTIWSPGPKHETQHGFCNHMVILTQHAHTYMHAYIHR